MNYEQLAKHRTEDDCYICISGKIYDITRWLNTHPGGKDLLLVAAGRDATHLLTSYHPFSPHVIKMIDKYYKCDLIPSDEDHPVYRSPPGMESFYPTLCKRVGEYFKETKQHPKYHPFLVWRAIIIYAILPFFYYQTLWGAGAKSTVAMVACALIWGFLQAIFSLQFMHDSSHAALTSNPTLWRVVGATWDFTTGASFYSWLFQHTVGHHLYTNVRGTDPDIGAVDPQKPELRRITQTQKMYGWYALQHLYVWAMYPLLTFKFRISDFTVLGSGMNGAIPVTPPTRWALGAFWFGKIMFPVMRFILPMATGSPHSALTLFAILMIVECVTGGWLAFNFQVSHVAPDCDFLERPTADGAVAPAPPALVGQGSGVKPKSSNANVDVNANDVAAVNRGAHKEWNVLNVDWAASQVFTAQNYSILDKKAPLLDQLVCHWVAWQSGALNYQIEHHLFPTVQQLHYPAIAPIVKKTCEEYGVKYNVLPTFASAVASHIRHLKNHSCESHSHY